MYESTDNVSGVESSVLVLRTEMQNGNDHQYYKIILETITVKKILMHPE